jgi:hypothetical protein
MSSNHDANEDWHGGDDDFASRKGRRDATRKMRHWLGELDHEELDEWTDSDALDEIPKFERLRSRRKQRQDF